MQTCRQSSDFSTSVGEGYTRPDVQMGYLRVYVIAVYGNSNDKEVKRGLALHNAPRGLCVLTEYGIVNSNSLLGTLHHV